MNEIISKRNLKYKRKSDQVNLSLGFEFLDFGLDISFSTRQAEELYVEDLFYYSESLDDNLNIVDFFFELLSGKPVEVFDRITVKELDFFIRSERSIPAFPFYSQQHFEIVAIGKKIYNHIIGISSDKADLYIVDELGPSSVLSLSEQIEYFEEFCSQYIYPFAIYETIELYISDIEGDDIFFEQVSERTLLKDIENKFNKEFKSCYKFHIKS